MDIIPRPIYTDLVHNNPKLTAITKFCQLKGHLKGLALDAISGFKMSSADYDAAWFCLQKRYNKPDKIIDEYLKKFEELPYLTHPTAPLLLNMVNRTNQLLRVLPTLGVDVSNWDTMIKYKLKGRLDRATYTKWLDQEKLRTGVPLTELLEFIEIEAEECMPRDVPHRRFNKQQQNKQPARCARVMAIAVDEPPAKAQPAANPSRPHFKQAANKPQKSDNCPQCKSPMHRLYECPTFLKLNITDRNTKQKLHGVCRRCLNKHQDPNDCKFGVCPRCKKDHNILLCFMKERKSANPTPNSHPDEPEDQSN